LRTMRRDGLRARHGDRDPRLRATQTLHAGALRHRGGITRASIAVRFASARRRNDATKWAGERKVDNPMAEQSNFAGNIAYDDLREWVAMAERLAEVRTVKGANCEEEIGLAAEAGGRAGHRPCG